MSKSTDTEIHQREILITLIYLLKYCDKNHPAKQIDICKYAKKFGLHFDLEETSGNDIKRQRISSCLQYLQSLSLKHENNNEFPFIINSTEGGKFYAELKNQLSTNQITKILSAIKNDKFIDKDESQEIIDKLIDILSNKYNKKICLDKLRNTKIKANNYDTTLIKKINLLSEALSEKKLIEIFEISCIGLYRYDAVKDDPYFYPQSDSSIKHHNFIKGHFEKPKKCFVYKLDKYKNSPYAILIPLSGKGLICEKIDNINIRINEPKNKILYEDLAKKERNLNDLFKANNPFVSSIYETLDDYINKQIFPQGKFSFKTSFFFLASHYKEISQSFKDYFGIDMPVIFCNYFNINKDKVINNKNINIPKKYDDFAIDNYIEVSEDEHPHYGIVNIEINESAFCNWLLDNHNIAYLINIVSPENFNETIFLSYMTLVSKLYFRSESKSGLFKYMDKLIDQFNKDKQKL